MMSVEPIGMHVHVVQYVARLKKRGPGNEGIGSHRKVESVCT